MEEARKEEFVDPMGTKLYVGNLSYSTTEQTLRAAFEETDRSRLIQQITQAEPPRPRKIERCIPADLEIHDRQNRPVALVPEGSPVRDLFAY